MAAALQERINAGLWTLLNGVSLLSATLILVAMGVFSMAAQPCYAFAAFQDTNIPPYGLEEPRRIHLGHAVVLEDDKLRVAFDSRSGALTRLEDASGHWIIERRPKLGVSFRLFAPLPGRRWDPIFGQNQKAVEVKKVSDHEVRFIWKNLISYSDGVLPMTLTANVTLTNGELTFSAMLQNDSSLTVETIDYPYFGDFNPPSRNTTNMAVRLMRNNNPNDFISDEIYPHFNNQKGYWGVFWPTKILDSESSPFCLIQAPNEGVYLQPGNGRPPYRLQYTFEQHPGVTSSVTQSVPQEDEIAGTPVHLEFRTCHFIFQKPHSKMNLTPVVLRCYRGDWHIGGEIFKQSVER